MTFLGAQVSSAERSVFLSLACACGVSLLSSLWQARHACRGGGAPFLLLPLAAAALAYENLLLFLDVGGHSGLAQVGKATHAMTLPLLLVVVFEMPFVLHRRRSAKFCGVKFDESDAPGCAMFVICLERMVALGLCVLGVLVNYDLLPEDDSHAGKTGYYNLRADATMHIVLGLVPSVVVGLVACYLSKRMWRYGEHVALNMESASFWVVVVVGSLCMLAGQCFPRHYYAVSSNAGETVFVCALAMVQPRVVRDILAGEEFSRFLERANRSFDPRGNASAYDLKDMGRSSVEYMQRSVKMLNANKEDADSRPASEANDTETPARHSGGGTHLHTAEQDSESTAHVAVTRDNNSDGNATRPAQETGVLSDPRIANL